MEQGKPTLAKSIIHSLAIRPLCDSQDTDELTPEQAAALHAFKFETLAAYWRLCMVVPEKAAERVISKRLAKIFDDYNKPK